MKRKINKEFDLYLNSKNLFSFRSIIINAYRLGYTPIKIFNLESKTQSELTEIINLLPGSILSNLDRNTGVIEFLGDYNLENAFKDFLDDIDSLFADFYISRGSNIEIIENKIQTSDNLCRRTNALSEMEFLQLRLSLNTELCHAQKEIYFSIKDIKKAQVFSARFVNLFSQSNNLYNILKKSYLERNLEGIESVHNLHREILKGGYSALEESSTKEKTAYHHLLNAIRNFSMTTSPMIGILMHDETINSRNI